jgi:hypothetical protein
MSYWEQVAIASGLDFQRSQLAIADGIREAAKARDAWVDAALRKHAPEIAEAPDRLRRWLEAVQQAIATTSPLDAARLAAAVAADAGYVLHLHAVYRQESARLAERAPVGMLRVRVEE